jgi:thiamine kinase-like enzyme
VLELLAQDYEAAVEFLASLPVSFIHGEFYASNVLVEAPQKVPRVCAVDWELAGIGPGVIDLAALIVGDWTRVQRFKILDAYRSGLPADHPWANDVEELSHSVSVAELHLAVQWLGWSPDWTPPAAHAFDWFEEAVGLGERLGLL